MAIAEPIHDTEPSYTIAEVAEAVAMSAHTLRYYERIGLVDVARDASGHRSYSNANLARLRFISYLRATQLPIRDLRRYFRLADEGPHTAAERLDLLQEHRDVVRDRLEATEAALAAIDIKIDLYGGRLTSCDVD